VSRLENAIWNIALSLAVCGLVAVVCIACFADDSPGVGDAEIRVRYEPVLLGKSNGFWIIRFKP
jgi:hypothetical protein